VQLLPERVDRAAIAPSDAIVSMPGTAVRAAVRAGEVPAAEIGGRISVAASRAERNASRRRWLVARRELERTQGIDSNDAAAVWLRQVAAAG
jgi:hypothetical protein